MEILPPALPGLKVAVEDGALTVNERKVPFSTLLYGRPKKAINTTLLPIVGGWRALMEKEDLLCERSCQMTPLWSCNVTP